MNNYMPQLQVLQLKMTEARNSGDQLNGGCVGVEGLGVCVCVWEGVCVGVCVCVCVCVLILLSIAK